MPCSMARWRRRDSTERALRRVPAAADEQAVSPGRQLGAHRQPRFDRARAPCGRPECAGSWLPLPTTLQHGIVADRHPRDRARPVRSDAGPRSRSAPSWRGRAGRAAPPRAAQQPAELIGIQGVRELAFDLGRAHALRRVGADAALAQQVGETRRGVAERRRCRLLAPRPAGAVRRVGPHLVASATAAQSFEPFARPRRRNRSGRGRSRRGARRQAPT